MISNDVTFVQKSCAYVTRAGRELLVFEGPEHDGLQVPKGTIEFGETPREALHREVMEESGLDVRGSTRYLTTDVWTRRHSPPRKYVRHFFRASVDEPRDRWTHVVTGGGAERGLEYEFSWVDLPPERSFALSLDDYVHLLGDRRARTEVSVVPRDATSRGVGTNGGASPGFTPTNAAITPNDP